MELSRSATGGGDGVTVWKSKEAADAFGVTVHRVYQLCKDGVFDKDKDGNIDSVEAIRGWLEYKTGTTGAQDVKQQIDLQVLRIKTAQADKAETESEATAGALLPVDDMFDFVDGIFTETRTKLAGVGSKLSPRLVDESDIPTIAKIINDEIHEALEGVADGKAEGFIRTKKAAVRRSAASSKNNDE